MQRLEFDCAIFQPGAPTLGDVFQLCEKELFQAR